MFWGGVADLICSCWLIKWFKLILLLKKHKTNRTQITNSTLDGKCVKPKTYWTKLPELINWCHFLFVFQGSWRWRFPGRISTMTLWLPRWTVCTCWLFLEPVSDDLCALWTDSCPMRPLHHQISQSHARLLTFVGWPLSCRVRLSDVSEWSHMTLLMFIRIKDHEALRWIRQTWDQTRSEYGTRSGAGSHDHRDTQRQLPSWMFVLIAETSSHPLNCQQCCFCSQSEVQHLLNKACWLVWSGDGASTYCHTCRWRSVCSHMLCVCSSWVWAENVSIQR